MELRHKEYDEALKVCKKLHSAAQTAAILSAGCSASSGSEESSSFKGRQGRFHQCGVFRIPDSFLRQDDVQNRLYRSTKLWSLCIDLEELSP